MELIYFGIILTVLCVHNLRLQWRISDVLTTQKVMADESAKLFIFTSDILLEQNICEIPMDVNNPETRKQLILNQMKDLAPVHYERHILLRQKV